MSYISKALSKLGKLSKFTGSYTAKLKDSDLSDGEQYFGLENYSNICYCNSVLQCLYYCDPFREGMLQYYDENINSKEENLLLSLGDLFNQINQQKKKTGVVQTKKFMNQLKHENEQFRSTSHQDAQEFLNFVLTKTSEVLEKQLQAQTEAESSTTTNSNAHSKKETPKTFIQEIFEGVLVNQTTCLHCETVTSTNEEFKELSLGIEANTSVTHSLKTFSKRELLEDKYECSTCRCPQQARRQSLIKKAPKMLVLHLKRFSAEFKKIPHRLVFPMDLRLFNMCVDTEGSCSGVEPQYHLMGVVVHLGQGMNHGHYVSYINVGGKWLYFDDEHVEVVDESQINKLYGQTQDGACQSSVHGYLLFYKQHGFSADSMSSSTACSSQPAPVTLGTIRSSGEQASTSDAGSSANGHVMERGVGDRRGVDKNGLNEGASTPLEVNRGVYVNGNKGSSSRDEKGSTGGVRTSTGQYCAHGGEGNGTAAGRFGSRQAQGSSGLKHSHHYVTQAQQQQAQGRGQQHTEAQASASKVQYNHSHAQQYGGISSPETGHAQSGNQLAAQSEAQQRADAPVDPQLPRSSRTSALGYNDDVAGRIERSSAGMMGGIGQRIGSARGSAGVSISGSGVVGVNMNDFQDRSVAAASAK